MHPIKLFILKLFQFFIFISLPFNNFTTKSIFNPSTESFSFFYFAFSLSVFIYFRKTILKHCNKSTLIFFIKLGLFPLFFVIFTSLFFDHLLFRCIVLFLTSLFLIINLIINVKAVKDWIFRLNIKTIFLFFALWFIKFFSIHSEEFAFQPSTNTLLIKIMLYFKERDWNILISLPLSIMFIFYTIINKNNKKFDLSLISPYELSLLTMISIIISMGCFDFSKLLLFLIYFLSKNINFKECFIYSYLLSSLINLGFLFLGGFIFCYCYLNNFSTLMINYKSLFDTFFMSIFFFTLNFLLFYFVSKYPKVSFYILSLSSFFFAFSFLNF